MIRPRVDLRRHSAVVVDLGIVPDFSRPATPDNRHSEEHPAESLRRLLHRLERAGVGVTVFSPRGDAKEMLADAGLDEALSVAVDEPTPQEALARLRIPSSSAVLVTADGQMIAMARGAGFALVIGMERKDRAGEFPVGVTDAVVQDLDDIDLRTRDHHLSEIPDPLESEADLAALLRVHEPVVVLDLDSATAETAPTSDLRDALARLAHACPVVVLSGRDLADVQDLIGIPGLWYAGNRGFELGAPDGATHEHPGVRTVKPIMERVSRFLTERLQDVPAVRVDPTPSTVVVHDANTPDDYIGEVTAAVYDARDDGDLRVARGQDFWELQPGPGWDKGTALRWVLGVVGDGDSVAPLYIGGEPFDEDAFDVLPHDGVGIVVRHRAAEDRRSAARFAVNGTSGVTELLDLVADVLDRNPSDASRAGGWSLFYDHYDPASEKLREALCTLGNGFFATRGCAPEAVAGRAHYPGTYIAGLYNRLRDDRPDMTLVNESLVNAPNWLPLTFRIDGGPWFDVDTVDLLDYRQYLDLRRAVLTRRVRFRDSAGRTTTVLQRRFVAMHLAHVGALQTTVVAHDWTGVVEFRSSLDGSVRNTLVDRYRELADHHLVPVDAHEVTSDSVVLSMQTNQSHIPLATAARTTIRSNGNGYDSTHRLFENDGSIGHFVSVHVDEGRTVTAEKTVTVFTGRDSAVSDPADGATRLLSTLGTFDEILGDHVRVWDHLWGRTHITLADREDSSRILRLHMLHLLQTLSRNTTDIDAGVPARGLHGEAYRGHVFWDELFVFPVLNLRKPSLTRSLLMYRYRRLPEARRAAGAAGLRGAMFPWQSGSDGREESQQWHLNPRSGRWLPDPSRRQHHIGIAVAFNVWQYYQVTGDLAFLGECGAEMLVEIARFFASLASYDGVRSRYVIRGVVGPDEFHSGYPEAPYDGIDNNAYTNVMAVWVILRAVEALAALADPDRTDLMDRLHLDADELARWTDVTRRIFVPFHDGVLSQFEGYGDLAELDWDGYRQRYGDIARLDRILEAEGDDVNRYRASKQADVVMLFYLLSADELRDLLGRAGYRFEPDAIPRTIDYYLARTSHGSTLSAVVHSWVLARGHREEAVEYFERVLVSDVTDIQGGTTPEGIHLAAMAGSIDLLQRCFTGLETRGNRLILNPQWPEHLGPLKFPMRYRGHYLDVSVHGRKVEVTAGPGDHRPIKVMCRDRTVTLHPGSTVALD
ncbi:trehalose-phosphatase [Rhodococcus coprophilus]|nr:trehalose-phosphatase [Rhodococcus coprophilus]